MRSILIAALTLVVALPAFAQNYPPPESPSVVKVAAGANAVTFDGAANLPSDFELGGNGRTSLSPHLSAVGSAYYGFSHTYLRGSAGVRVTATDVADPNFSIGFGAQYQASSKPSLRPQEWAPDASVGWRPWPEKMPKVTLAAQGSYGLTSKQAMLLLGARYELSAF